MEPPPPPKRKPAPFLIPAGLLAAILVLASMIMLAAEVWPPVMGWTFFLLSLGCLALCVIRRPVDPEDPSSASFTAFAATAFVALLIFNAVAGASNATRTIHGYARVAVPSEADVVLLRPLGNDRSFAFRSMELREELTALIGAEVSCELTITRSFGKIRSVSLATVAERSVALGAIGLIEHREDGVMRRVRLRGGGARADQPIAQNY